MEESGMSKSLATLFLELSPWEPIINGLWLGFIEVGFDFVVRLTPAGIEYLESMA
jgi:hypothetical protein